MKGRLWVAVIFLIAISASGSARAQVLVETGRILSPKTKDLGEIIDKAAKGPKEVTKAQPRGETLPGAQPSRTTRPAALPDTFSSDTEPPESILDINPDVLTRFSTSLASESAKRDQGGAHLTRKEYDEIGAQAGGFTPRQYFVLKARVRPFCDAIAAGQAPPNDLRFSYMPTETLAIKPRCASLLPELKHNM